MPRLMTIRQICSEKIARSRSWLKARDDFPAPAVAGNPALYSEPEVDAWLAKFMAAQACEKRDEIAKRAAAARDARASKTAA